MNRVIGFLSICAVTLALVVAIGVPSATATTGEQTLAATTAADLTDDVRNASCAQAAAAYRAAIRASRNARDSAIRTIQRAYLASRNQARTVRDSALAVATSKAERTAVHRQYRQSVKAAALARQSGVRLAKAIHKANAARLSLIHLSAKKACAAV